MVRRIVVHSWPHRDRGYTYPADPINKKDTSGRESFGGTRLEK